MTIADSALGVPLTTTVAPALAVPSGALASAAATNSAGATSAPAQDSSRTIWGLDPVQLHTRYWASHGVQVVRQGEPSEIVSYFELFPPTENDALTLFRL